MAKKKNTLNPLILIAVLIIMVLVSFLALDFLKSKKGMSSFLFGKTEEIKKVSSSAVVETQKQPVGQTDRKVKIYKDRDVPPPPYTPPDTPVKGAPKIAIIIDDVGYDLKTLGIATEIEQPLTFAILPYTPHALECSRIIHNSGHEAILHLPMEPSDYPEVNPGKGAVLTSMDRNEIEKTVRENIKSLPYIVGVNNHMGSKATSDPATMRITLETIRKFGLYFVDSRTTTETVGYSIASELGIKTAQKTLFIDNEHEVKYICDKIDKLAEEAVIRGEAVGIGHIYPETAEALRQKLPELEDRGFKIVFASNILKNP